MAISFSFSFSSISLLSTQPSFTVSAQNLSLQTDNTFPACLIQNCDDIISQQGLVSRHVFLLSNVITTGIHLHVCTLVLAPNKITFQSHKSGYVTWIWWKETMQSDRLSTVQDHFESMQPPTTKNTSEEPEPCRAPESMHYILFMLRSLLFTSFTLSILCLCAVVGIFCCKIWLYFFKDKYLFLR